MALPVVIVPAGGIAAVRLTVHGGLPVTLAAQGLAVTEAPSGIPLTFVTEGGSVVIPVPPATYAGWDAATVANVTLSGGNLVATNTGTSSADQGAKVAAAAGKTSGKYYFEMAFTNAPSAGVNCGIGIGTTASTYTNMGNGGTTGVVGYRTSSIYSNGSSVGNWAALVTGNTGGVAIDLDNRKIWFRQSPAGIWNNSGVANPATNAGGVTVPAGTMVPFALFGGAGGASGNVITANFGASAFSGTVPAGFTSGWPT